MKISNISTISSAETISENVTSHIIGSEDSNNSEPIDIRLFQCCVLVTGVVGLIANGVVLTALLNKKIRNRANYLLIINQVSLDCYSSIMLVITFAIQMGVVNIVEPWGDAVCKLFYGQFLLYVGVHASIASLVFITLERYVKIVHHVYHRKYFRKWMISVAVVICWVSGVINTCTVLASQYASNGECVYDINVFGSVQGATIYSILLIVWHYIVPILIFIWSYVHIFITVRKSSQVGHGRSISDVVPGSSNENAPSLSRGQMTIMRTCMIVSTTFLICWFLNNFIYLMSVVSSSFTDANFNVTFIATFTGFFNMCINPFIYAFGLDEVKKQVISNVCRRQVDVEPESIATGTKKRTTATTSVVT